MTLALRTFQLQAFSMLQESPKYLTSDSGYGCKPCTNFSVIFHRLYQSYMPPSLTSQSILSSIQTSHVAHCSCQDIEKIHKGESLSLRHSRNEMTCRLYGKLKLNRLVDCVYVGNYGALMIYIPHSFIAGTSLEHTRLKLVAWKTMESQLCYHTFLLLYVECNKQLTIQHITAIVPNSLAHNSPCVCIHHRFIFLCLPSGFVKAVLFCDSQLFLKTIFVSKTLLNGLYQNVP